MSYFNNRIIAIEIHAHIILCYLCRTFNVSKFFIVPNNNIAAFLLTLILWPVTCKVFVINMYPFASQGCPEDAYRIMAACWNAERSERPSFQNIVECFEVILFG